MDDPTIASCHREAEVLAALESSQGLAGTLRRHVEDCAACRETVWVHGLMTEDAHALAERAEARQGAGHWVTPDALWTAARRGRRLARGPAAVRRALLPIRIVEWMSGLLAALGVLLGLIRGLPAAASGTVPWLSSLGRGVASTVERGVGALEDVLAVSPSVPEVSMGSVSLLPLLVLFSVAAVAAGLWRGWSEG